MDYNYLKVIKCSGSNKCALCSSFTSGRNSYKLSCDCKEHFHKGCLKKWFKEVRSCPICIKQCNPVII